MGSTMKTRIVSSRAARTIRSIPHYRGYAIGLLIIFVASTLMATAQPFMKTASYKLDAQSKNILPDQNPQLAKLLKFDPKKGSYEYNAGYDGTKTAASGDARITASLNTDATKGITVSDATAGIDLTIKPKFSLAAAQQDSNQIVYPMNDQQGALVYTAQVTGVKEDILLQQYDQDSVSYDYDLNLPSGLVARLETNGSIGVYGSDMPITGSVSTGTDKDKMLLEKVRQNAPKNTLVFSIPAPVTVESNKTVSQVRSHFELNGTTMRVVSSNLKGASYPLTIDPSIYVETAQKLMRGNNESNIDFDTTNELIKKGKLTGGRFDNWTTSTALPNSVWGQGTAVAGGYVYAVGGSSGSTPVSTVYWAKLNTTTGSIDAPNPGSGACASWCTDSSYNLPVATTDLSLVAYSGYLYVFGGETGSGTTNAVYIAKLGANGEPSLWHPTDTNKNNWVYWYSATSLTSTRSYAGAAAYNNHMYLVGGRSTGATGGVSTVEVANINPVGTLGGWSTTGMVALPSVRHSFSMQVYNDRMYILGGDSGGVLQSSVQYIKLNNDGTMAGSWSATTAMSSGRISQGGNFSTIWGGYIYIAGGCTDITGTGDYCSVAGISTGRDIQLASINADGTVSDWNTIIGINSSRVGYGLVGWRDVLYGIGGCSAQNTTTGACTTTLSSNSYGVINPDGDVSQTDNSVASGTTPCSGTSPTNCDIPPAGDAAGQGGRMSMGVVANNGYIYIVGGCTDISTTTECFASNTGQMSGNVSYAAMAFDGSLVRAATCSGTFYGSWCVDSTHRINGTTGLGAMGITVFNNRLYVVGGTDGNNWSANVYQVNLNLDGSLASTWSTQTFSTLNIGTARGFLYTFARASATDNTYPGDLYIIGGCNNGTRSNGIDCSTYFTQVYKCSILADGTLETANANDCTTTGQLQIDSEPNTTGLQGMGAMAGTVYAGYIYLIAGTSPNDSSRGDVLYAKLDDSNNIVAVSGTNWTISPNSISPVRKRGSAFGYNGYLYSLAGYSGSGSLNDVLYAKINVADGSIGTFTTSFVTVNPRWELRAFVSNGSVYAMGGCSAGAATTGCTAMTGSIQVFRLYNNSSGTPAGYSAINNPGVDRIGGSTAISNGYIYYAGGCSVIACTTAVTNVYYAAIAPDGTIGTWTAASGTSNLPAVRAWGKLQAVGGTLYYSGGQDSAAAAQSTVYYSTPASGVPAAWATATNGLPAARSEVGSAIWNNRIYIVGGINAGTRQNTIYVSPQLASGGDITSAWTTTTGFNVARSGEVVITYANNMYVLGGYNGTNYLYDVQYAKIDSAGAVSGWHYTSSLPQRVYEGDGYAANGYIYVFGGRSASATCTNSTYVGSISANTPIASGNNPTGVANWGQTNVLYGGARYGLAATYSDGKAYIFGGGCSAFVASGDRGYGSTLQSQPQISKYSRAIDTDTDVFPTKWLMNGLDNDIGARWKLRYRTSTASTDLWGQETNYGTVTLGTPDNYIPLDAAGANSTFARYFYFSLSIDSSQAFGYPDDVTRGPTIDDITLFFTSDPSKRLRHGATFTGGQLQPLDTPF
jgi:hypothetical protein